MWRGLRTAAGEDDHPVASPVTVVKPFHIRPSIVASQWIAARAVKAVSRAQRGQSGTTAARRALSARVASRTITTRRPLSTTRIQRVQRRGHTTGPRLTAPAEAETAWRERPPPWPRALQATRSRMVVAHATVLPLTTSPAVSQLSGGTRRRPMRPSGNSQR